MLILMDNGSLEPASTLALRELSARLSVRLARPVAPVSLLHSSKIPADALGGVPADTLETFLKNLPEADAGDVSIVPLFFGPSLALCDYLPARLASLGRRRPGLSVSVAPCLCGDLQGEEAVADMLARAVRERLAQIGGPAPVVLVDHGSPAAAVTAVRDRLAMALRRRLGDAATGVLAASMERREGDEYAFNEPLLADALRMPGFDSGDVIVALQFLFPGRHAGPSGDIDQICAAAGAASPALRCHMTRTLGGDDALLELLAHRAAQL